jgi:hypothetical protein
MRPSSLWLTATLLCIVTTGCVIPPSISIPAPQKTSSPTFPEMRVKNLMNETKEFPREFPSDRTLLRIAFQREQQETLDDWSKRLKLDDPGAFLRWFVDTGMRSGIPHPKIRARVFTIFAPCERFVGTQGKAITRGAQIGYGVHASACGMQAEA